ncbi:Gfo/Idh/MocA family oxidoreductase [soil metagenome]
MSELAIDTKPKIGFVGVGWIGKNRMEAIANKGIAEVAWIQDADPQLCNEAINLAPNARILDIEDKWEETELDGIVIATPSALHASQSIKALNQGKAVFCQKPLGRNLQETTEVVNAAKVNDKLLSVDFSYRYTNAVQALKKIIDSGEVGDIYAVDLVFHNAYGPDKTWYFNRELSGGGCLIDLGVHLVDLFLWISKYPEISSLHSSLFSKGKLLAADAKAVEDYVSAQFVFNEQISVQLSCSWNLPAGCNAVIKADFYGTKGGVSFHNINGSFYDFQSERYVGTSKEVVSSGPDDWGGKAAVAWAESLAKGNKFNEEALQYIEVAKVLEAIYQKV